MRITSTIFFSCSTSFSWSIVASFVETYKEEALLRPWLLDNQFIELQAEAALEDRDISEAEWRATTWYQTHSQAERDWMDIELSDPSEAQRQREAAGLYDERQLDDNLCENYLNQKI